MLKWDPPANSKVGAYSEPVVTSVGGHKPSVMLNWDQPAHAGCATDVTEYRIQFWDEKEGCHNETSVDGSTTNIIITRELGLRTLTTTTFVVRAYCGDDVSEERRTTPIFVGMCMGKGERLSLCNQWHSQGGAHWSTCPSN